MNFKEGQYIEFNFKNTKIEGLINNKEKDIVFIKLKSGYNIGLLESNIKNPKILDKIPFYQKQNFITKKENISPDKPNILLLHMGGTIASRVDYKTGAVYPSFDPEDILALVPEKKDSANFTSLLIENILSENILPRHWTLLAEKISSLYKNYDGIIVAHGTDTLSYTSAALSFALQGIPLPVLLVGAQRSSDRPSTEAVQNLSFAIDLILSKKFKGIGIIMNKDLSENPALFHPLKTRKMHTSRRDAFCPINTKLISLPLKNSFSFDSNKTFEPKTKFEEKVILIKATPFLTSSFISSLSDYKAVVFEGTGFGHLNTNLLNSLKELSKTTKLIMTSQCLFGATNPNIYATGRLLKEINVIYAKDMLPETALIKASWILGNKLDFSLFTKNLCGEINNRLLESDSNGLQKYRI